MHNKKIHLVFKYNKPGFCWALIILILCSITTPNFKIPDIFDLFGPDKVVHFFFFAILVYLLEIGFTKVNKEIYINNSTTKIMTSCIAYGGLIELYQGYILTSRVADWTDFVANTIGCFIGQFAFNKLNKK